MQRVAALPRDQREEQIAGDILKGNVPAFLRQFKTVRITATLGDGKLHSIDLRVMPDYLAVGNDADFVRVPLTPMTAGKIAGAFGCVLPTKKIVDDVYRQADLKLEPRPMTESREAVATFLEHNRIIEEQRTGHSLGGLVAGIKKDVVLTNRLKEKPGHVAIYGWHKPDGEPIQPLTTVHVATYVDYSHGIRLVERKVVVDGKPMVIDDVLASPELNPLLSDEGPMRISEMYSGATTAPTPGQSGASGVPDGLPFSRAAPDSGAQSARDKKWPRCRIRGGAAETVHGQGEVPNAALPRRGGIAKALHFPSTMGAVQSDRCAG
jgi:hypothetical protein